MFEKFYKYEKKKRLGRGGMGEVYLAYDTVMKREVALKLVPDDKDSEAQDAIKAERAGAELQDRLVPFSDHVPKVHEYGIQDGSLYIDMEYVEGDDLAKLIFEKQLTYYQIIDIGIQVCEVLQVAHSLNVPISGQPIKGIAHGDIKPKNIRINKQGRVKLLDFGIAKALSLTRNLTHSAFGSMEYCSPERLNNGELGPAADLWALGAVLYEAVSGKKAFQASTPKGLENRICSGQPPAALPEHCPKLLSAIIFKALKPDKKERYQSAAEFKADLEQAGQGPTTKISPKETKGKQEPPGPGLPKEPPPPPPPPPPSNRKRSLVLIACVALLILGLGVGFNEYQVQAEALELSRDVSAAQVIHLADLEGLEQRYMKLKNRRRFFDWGLRNIEESLKSGWMGIADRVINDYHKDKPTLGQKDWNEARQSLGKIMNYFPNDPTAKGKAHYCDGLIAFMNGLDDRRNNRSGNSKFREALNHFRDAELLLGSWPDPHLGMAMVYSYGALDVKLAATEIGKLREMGFALGEQREHAMRADGLRVYADELYNRAKKLPTLELSELQEIRAMYQEALDHYNQILDFSVNARREGVGIPAKLREIDLKILMLENQE